ncbi:MAG: adenylate/guanylate cyclase domain-containing protein, partial [Actinomycetes bacterium]
MTERKVVTVLFCDLVGFTALCEHADPEDVDRLLRDYYTFARDLIERYGGSVEKFIGDAVVGAFGVPSAHEDDAERAVRAGWRLIEGVGEILGPAGEQLAVRVGINTGPALVRLDAGPRSGEGLLVGDAINTAQRLQTLAPPSGLVVGGRTRSLAAAVATYEALPLSALKGKSETVGPWRVTSLSARTGIDLAQRFSAPLVGREVELGVLKGLFEKAVASSTPQFALLSGEAGIGKTRLIFELARDLDERPDLLVTWRQARCLPYG